MSFEGLDGNRVFDAIGWRDIYDERASMPVRYSLLTKTASSGERTTGPSAKAGLITIGKATIGAWSIGATTPGGVWAIPG
jgi:hypothetical protein